MHAEALRRPRIYTHYLGRKLSPPAPAVYGTNVYFLKPFLIIAARRQHVKSLFCCHKRRRIYFDARPHGRCDRNILHVSAFCS